jgi:2-succinyl-5-enolpyruvyl-6-hydroxy-3-cyclohexene-1-carboxylate synthase
MSFDARPPVTDTATFCATLVDEWVRGGVVHAVIAPGSRSTPLALALAGEPSLSIHVAHDERSAAFIALGVGLESGRPAVLLCTSGTAAAHFHAAVIEADLSSVPMIVCTADRPSELWDVGAPQTIDQTRLYGQSVRFFAEPGVPSASTSGTWRSLASRSVHEALGASGRPGPVHLNLSFRDPLVGSVGELPAGRPDSSPWHGEPHLPDMTSCSDSDVRALMSVIASASCGVLVAGQGTSDPGAVLALGESLGWPVLADPRSGCRVPGSAAVAHADAVLRSTSFARDMRPDVVLRFGEPPASKVLNQWLAASGKNTIVATSQSRWSDPDRQAAMLVGERGLASELLKGMSNAQAGTNRAYLQRWLDADASAAAAIESEMSSVTEPSIARAVVSSMPSGGHLVVSSSMPIRDVEWFGGMRADITVHSNRGANGIDGVIATAIGVAVSSNAPTVCLIGDVAFLHDSSSLAALSQREITLTIVVIDNDGGGIFSFLPQGEQLESSRFEQLFGTPHGTDLVALSRAHGLLAAGVSSIGQMRDAVADQGQGVRVAVARVGSRTDNVAVHRRLNDAVVTAVDAFGVTA